MKIKEEKTGLYDENLKLLREYREGNMEAGERLAELNFPLVYSIAGRFSGRGADMSDLVESGNLGLVKAMKTFDFSHGCLFSTYAVPLIFGEIRRFLRDDGIIKVSREEKRHGADGGGAYPDCGSGGLRAGCDGQPSCLRQDFCAPEYQEPPGCAAFYGKPAHRQVYAFAECDLRVSFSQCVC